MRQTTTFEPFPGDITFDNLDQLFAHHEARFAGFRMKEDDDDDGIDVEGDDADEGADEGAEGAEYAPCAYEDSNNCVWDARHMGNGTGRSYVAKPDGRVIYVSHARAHYLLTGEKVSR